MPRRADDFQTFMEAPPVSTVINKVTSKDFIDSSDKWDTFSEISKVSVVPAKNTKKNQPKSKRPSNNP